MTVTIRQFAAELTFGFLYAIEKIEKGRISPAFLQRDL